MLGRRIGRGGLLRTAARTAVIAGTATAVSGGIRSQQEATAQRAAEAQAFEQQQQQIDAAARHAVYSQQAEQPPAPFSDELITQIQNLATMHAQGILSEDEFTAAKAKLLG